MWSIGSAWCSRFDIAQAPIIVNGLLLLPYFQLLTNENSFFVLSFLFFLTIVFLIHSKIWNVHRDEMPFLCPRWTYGQSVLALKNLGKKCLKSEMNLEMIFPMTYFSRHIFSLYVWMLLDRSTRSFPRIWLSLVAHPSIFFLM